jgi:hypothetical protein
MKWTARYLDCYGSRVLFYTLDVENGLADLTASRCNPRPAFRDFRTTFRIDEGPLARLIPDLRAMDPRSESRVTCGSAQSLRVEADGETLQRYVSGGGSHEARPVPRSFFDFFTWLEPQVLDQLPQEGTGAFLRPLSPPDEEQRARQLAEAVERVEAELEEMRAESRAREEEAARRQVFAPRLDPSKPRHSQFFRFTCPLCSHAEDAGLWIPYKVCARCGAGITIVRKDDGE